MLVRKLKLIPILAGFSLSVAAALAAPDATQPGAPAQPAPAPAAPSAVDILAKQGMDAYRRGDFAGALKLLEQRARLLPEDPLVDYFLANVYLQNREFDKCAKMYSACVRLAPTSEAGKQALAALEKLPAVQAQHAQQQAKAAAAPDGMADPKGRAAASESLVTRKPVDQAYNEALKRIKADRPTFKVQVDHLWDHLQRELSELSPRSKTYSIDLERIRREAEIEVEAMQLKELRHECRVLAPDKIDARAVPDLPQAKIDDSKNALGALYEYFKPEKPFDPFDMNLSPEVTANFLTLKDVFGDLKTYDPNARRIALQLYTQLKRTVETKQDSLDRDIAYVKSTLLRDIVQAKVRDIEQNRINSSSPYRQQTPDYQLSISKLPRADENVLTAMEREVSELTGRAQKRIKELQRGYEQQVDMSISGAKEQLSTMVASGLGSQLKHVSGTIQLVPLGTDLRTRNYVNFGDRSDDATKVIVKVKQVQPLEAKALKLKSGDPATAKPHK